MSRSLSRRSLPTALTALLALFAAACTDLPTDAGAFQLEADGTLWTAIATPTDLPSAATWLRYAPSGPDGEAATARVAELQRDARRARASGDSERADALTVEAMEVVARGMDAPGRGTLIRGMIAVDGWQRAVRETVVLDRVPELAAALDRVEQEREAASDALSEGRDVEAAIRLTLASEWARAWGPEGVALRVLDRVEERLAQESGEGGAERARHFVRSARQELAEGESLRAVQRALYALQLADGQGLSSSDDDARPRCGEFAC